ncbi:MAG: hypothetical protein FWF22_01070, partial [Treponema sp.]|nr:hypothetical protein [Treponema sp.]
VIDMYINPEYQTEHDELKLFKIRDKLWKNPKIISEFVSNVKNLSAEEIDLVKSWQRRHIKDKFLLLAYRPFYAIFMQPRENEAARIFGVKGMTTSIAEAMHSELPIMLDTVLLPFKDKIIYDSFLVPYTVTFGNNIRENLYNEFEEVLTKNGITTELK